MSGQIRPHPPQLFRSFEVFTHSPEQYDVPLWQRATQLDPQHRVVAPEHCTPHAPQLFASMTVLRSQPLSGSASQLAQPATHVKPHTPAAHVGVLCGGVLHGAPQAPQLFTSVTALTSQPLAGLPSQLEKPAEHPNPHEPPAQALVPFAVGLHDVLHRPQCARSVALLISQPGVVVPSQSTKPALQSYAHCEFAHTVFALTPGAHALPHVPQ